jgi:hypothetical protein
MAAFKNVDVASQQRMLRKQPGVVLIMVLVFLALFAGMAAALTSAVDLSLQSSRNQVSVSRAHAIAESGLFFGRHLLGGLPLSPNGTPQELLQAIADEINDVYAGTPVFNGQLATVEGTDVLLPLILFNAPVPPSGFTLSITYEGEDEEGRPLFRTTSEGTSGQARRVVSMEMSTQPTATILDYAIASRSRVTMTGNTRLTGANSPSEASMLSTTTSTNIPISLTGNGFISGDAAIVNPNGRIRTRGRVRIGGSEYIGIDEPEFPEFDTSIFEPYATNLITSNRVRGQALENIRVAAGSNTRFTGNTTIRGVVYIESPNRVKFTGNLTFTGVIVTEQPASPDLGANTITITGTRTCGALPHCRLSRNSPACET